MSLPAPHLVNIVPFSVGDDQQIFITSPTQSVNAKISRFVHWSLVLFSSNCARLKAWYAELNSGRPFQWRGQ